MRKRVRTGLAAAVLLSVLAGCERNAPDDTAPPPVPALYEWTGADGAREGWLFGTIHALPDGVTWRTDVLDDAVAGADMLVVEVATLDDGAGMARQFTRYAAKYPGGSLAARVSPSQRGRLGAALFDAGMRAEQFHHTDTWAVALTLSRNSGIGSSENGVDRALLQAFPVDRIRELEGVARQLAIFDGLAEADQLVLLATVLDERDTGKDTARRRLDDWRQGRLHSLATAGDASFLGDPELRAALLTARNTDWARKLDALHDSTGPMLVAVGAAHLPGPDGLIALLEARGFTLTRIQ